MISFYSESFFPDYRGHSFSAANTVLHKLLLLNSSNFILL